MVKETLSDITLSSIQAAAQRISPYIRHTPHMRCTHHRNPFENSSNITFKMECQQVTGAFKVRGALNKVLSLSEKERSKPLFAASGGNHGLAVAYAGCIFNLPTKIFLPEQTSDIKIQAIKAWGAEVVLAGRDIKEAIEAAHVRSLAAEGTYIHPFGDSDVIIGQGTLGLEIMQALPHMDTLVVAIGGGGLIGGVSVAAKAINPHIKIIGVEPEAYPTLSKSLAAGEIIDTMRHETVAVTLAVRETRQINYELVNTHVDKIYTLSEDELKVGAKWLWQEFSIAAEYSGAAALSALLAQKYRIQKDEKVCAIICGAGSDGVG